VSSHDIKMPERVSALSAAEVALLNDLGNAMSRLDYLKRSVDQACKNKDDMRSKGLEGMARRTTGGAMVKGYVVHGVKFAVQGDQRYKYFALLLKNGLGWSTHSAPRLTGIV